MNQQMEALLTDTKVAKALALIEADRRLTLAQQLELVAVPAPSNQEDQRSRYFARLLEEAGYEARLDRVGNVYAKAAGSSRGPTVLLTAHLDTIFDANTDLSLRREGDRYIAPGINDDTRGLAELLTIARAVKQAELLPVGDLIFCATVGEEGLGNLRGVKHLFAEFGKIDAFVSIDGTPTGSLVFCGTGSKRLRVTYQGAGGHSFGAFGIANPIHAMGRAIGEIARLKPAPEPKTTFNVGVVSGGTSVNSIAAQASMLIDMRSNCQQALQALADQVLVLLEKSLQEENAHWNGLEPVGMNIELVGDRPAGSQSLEAPILKIFQAATEAVGLQGLLVGHSSTDCNIPISLGIPAVTVGRGGRAGKSHTLQEWFVPEEEHLGPQRDLLGVLALVGLEGVMDPVSLCDR